MLYLEQAENLARQAAEGKISFLSPDGAERLARPEELCPHWRPAPSADGSLTQDPDFQLPTAAGPLGWSLYHDSTDAADSGPYGYGRRAAFPLNLSFDGTFATVMHEDGSRRQYQLDGGTGFFQPRGNNYDFLLTQVGSTTLTAGYTGDDLRAWKTAASTTTYFLYDGIRPVVELNGSGAVGAVNSFGAYGLVSRHAGSTSTYYTFDPQGSIAQRLDGSGGVLTSQIFDGFGVGSSTGSYSEPFGFGAQWGYYTDQETGLVPCALRYYDGGAGRWLNRDPIEYDGGVNLYAYVGSSPLSWIDALGLAKGGKQRLTGNDPLNNDTDDELKKKYEDPNTDAATKQKIIRIQKARKKRHSTQQKRCPPLPRRERVPWWKWLGYLRHQSRSSCCRFRNPSRSRFRGSRFRSRHRRIGIRQLHRGGA